MLIGYARTSTLDQVAGLDAQLRDLKAVGCEKIFAEQLSSVSSKREQLALAMDYAREGDTLCVTKLDRLARSVHNVVEIEQALHSKSVALMVMSPSIDTGTPMGRLLLNMMASIAQFEREIMLERQREGVQRAKALGRYRGRAPTAMARTADVWRLKDEGRTNAQIQRELGISESSVYRILRAPRP